MGRLEFAPERVPLIKLALHVAQMVLVFVAWCLEIAVIRGEDSTINGNNGWTFGLCFLSIPAWIYLCMAPRFPRTRKLADPRIMAIVDGLFAIFWLSAFASQAAFNSAGSCGQVCTLSKTIVGLAFFVCLFFVGSTIVSIYTVKYYQWNNGRLPGYPDNDNKKIRVDDNDPDKGAFSTEMHDDEAQYGAVNTADDHDDQTTAYGGGGYSSLGSRFGATDDGGYGSGTRTDLSYNDGRTDLSYNNASRTDISYGDTDTEYRPQTAATSSVGGHPYTAPSAVDVYEDDRPAHYPAAPYER
ncbi:hypothetical protein MKZ38_000906 [Zalerion maritima]|uniref:MARVEL domain-containing protein n=1 Tax=Zalerion maritima TaxID=339359 RepID=A0AAD5WV43_9PEZI|nr:hypothetical protein MKZ38_000906 [Zalerion maritima]